MGLGKSRTPSVSSRYYLDITRCQYLTELEVFRPNTKYRISAASICKGWKDALKKEVASHIPDCKDARMHPTRAGIGTGGDGAAARSLPWKEASSGWNTEWRLLLLENGTETRSQMPVFLCVYASRVSKLSKRCLSLELDGRRKTSSGW